MNKKAEKKAKQGKVVSEPVEPVGTPNNKTDNKREASSPLDAQDLLQKKHCHESGSSTASENTVSLDAGDVGDVHLLSQPMNPVDIVEIARELRSIMLPEMRALFKEQLPEIRAMMTELMQETVQNLNEEVHNLKEENQRLWQSNDNLAKRLTQVEQDNDSLEQYSRRNSIRVSGVPEVASEDTDKVIIHIAETLDVPINRSDIDRSHRVGRIDNRGSGDGAAGGRRRHRDIIVKFATYNAKQRLYSKRKDLRENEDMRHLYINEDLTRLRSKLLFDARCLVRAGKLKAAYASDGKIFVRDNGERRHLIKTKSDLSLFGDPKDSREQMARNINNVNYMPSTSAGVAQPMDL